MPSLFTPDLFTCADLCASVNRIPYVPSLLRNVFESDSSRTVNIAIDVEESHLTLVPDSKRGIPGQAPARKNDRKTKVIAATHLIATDTIHPEDVQDVRAFGSTELETIAQRIAKKQANLRRNIEATLEYHRVGAVKGEVLDANGTTVLHDIYNTFGIIKPNDISLTWPSSASGAKNTVLAAIQGVVEDIEDAMGGVPFDGVMAICGSDFWTHLVGNPFVREAYNLWAANRPAFGQAHDWTAGMFSYGGVYFARYSRSVGGNTLVNTKKAHFFPVGPGIFKHVYAPADYMETVNTDGMEFYSRMDAIPKDRGYELEVQSNPLTICLYPDALRCIAADE